MTAIRNVNDGTAAPGRLVCMLNMGTLGHLPDWSAAPRVEGAELYAAIREAGYEGVQGGEPELAREAGLMFTDSGRVDEVGQADELCRKSLDRGALCATIHVGNGLEDDATIDRVVRDIIDASARHDLPLYIETHRATITQDIHRTTKLAQRLPGVRYNGDFSHWYTGLEMPYGGVELKCDFASPVFERVRYLHARIGNPGCIQVDIGDSMEEAASRSYVQHFMHMWKLAMAGFLNAAGPGDILPFAPELLFPSIYYARTFADASGTQREECDRWTQALLYCEIARHCFEETRVSLVSGSG